MIQTCQNNVCHRWATDNPIAISPSVYHAPRSFETNVRVPQIGSWPNSLAYCRDDDRTGSATPTRCPYPTRCRRLFLAGSPGTARAGGRIAGDFPALGLWRCHPAHVRVCRRAQRTRQRQAPVPTLSLSRPRRQHAGPAPGHDHRRGAPGGHASPRSAHAPALLLCGQRLSPHRNPGRATAGVPPGRRRADRRGQRPRPTPRCWR